MLVVSKINIKELLSFDCPSIKIKDINIIESERGKVLCYTINLYSPSQIKDFVAIPNIEGANSDSKTKFKFDNHTRRATVVYYYALPEISNEDKISIKFSLNNNVNQIDKIVCSNCKL